LHPYQLVKVIITQTFFKARQMIISTGHYRKDPSCPREEISAVWRGRGEKFVSDNSKCIRTSEGGRVNVQFPPWGRYGCFLE
jgi:hypothetical protein